ncbi:hypothetical protein A3Q56_06223 [Intoshia linei]|uniref:Tc1-like transposase DDE domain-containing protein n=1 Tax=Intoshia linei TaxID=1819745 RepID=A0A177AVP3_9BILA|nr:hypothetical protein A3Q56_06223 [Intoshia linei]
MAEEENRLVLFTPPYHSDLQPIELIWAITKKLNSAFNNLFSDIIQCCIRKTDSLIKNLSEKIVKIEMLAESSEDSNCSNII